MRRRFCVGGKSVPQATSSLSVACRSHWFAARCAKSTGQDTGVKPGQRPAAACRRQPLRAHRSGRNGCRCGAAASVRRNSRIPHAPHASTPDGCGAFRRGMGRSFSLVRPWDSAPSLTKHDSRFAQGMTKIHDRTKRKPRRLADRPGHRNGLWIPARTCSRPAPSSSAILKGGAF